MLLNLKEGEYMGQSVLSLNNDFFKLSITDYGPHSTIEKHYHDNNYLSILIKGNYYERNKKEEKLVEPGNILFRPGAYIHENLFKDAGGSCFNIEFKPGWIEALNTDLQLPSTFTHFKTGSFPSLYKLLLNFKNEYCEMLAVELICDWLFTINQTRPVRSYHPQVEKVGAILENEKECFHSLRSLSQRVFIHPVYLARAFKQKKGITIGEYQLKIKLANAVALLLNTSLSISDIAYSNGFYDDAHFIRSFKAVYKISPYQFRLSVKS